MKTKIPKSYNAYELQKTVDCVPVRLPNTILHDIESISELLTHTLKNNPDLSTGSFYQIFFKEHKKIKNLKKTKIAKIRKLFYLLHARKDDKNEINQKCLLKCFTSFLLKAMIWDLEIRKLNTSIVSLDESKLYSSVFEPLGFFYAFFKNYDSKNSKTMIGLPFSRIEKVIDDELSNDFSYYESLKKNSNSLDTKLESLSDYLMYDNKETALMDLPDVSPNDRKNEAKRVTSMIGTICNKNGFPDIDKIFQQRKLEKNRLLCNYIDDNILERILRLYLMRARTKQYPRHEKTYKDMRRLLKRKFPEFVIV